MEGPSSAGSCVLADAMMQLCKLASLLHVQTTQHTMAERLSVTSTLIVSLWICAGKTRQKWSSGEELDWSKLASARWEP